MDDKDEMTSVDRAWVIGVLLTCVTVYAIVMWQCAVWAWQLTDRVLEVLP